MQEIPFSQTWMGVIVAAIVTAIVGIAVQRTFDSGSSAKQPSISRDPVPGKEPVAQRSYGNGSPNVSNVGGDVEIKIGK